MKANYAYFLVVAEELSITKAAKRLYISQQCLSNHIHRLEEEMNAQLFVRKPIPRLTPAGEMLVGYIRKIQQLEYNIHDEIDELNHYNRGQLHIGVHSSRARILLPLLVQRYSEQMRQIKINIMDGMTADFDKRLKNGTLDAYIGLNPPGNPDFETYLLLHEDVYLGISNGLLQDHFGPQSDTLLAKANTGLDIGVFSEVPFILNHQDSALTRSIDVTLGRLGVQLNRMIQVNGNDVHIELSGMGMGACFVPAMFLPYIDQINSRAASERSIIRIFRLNDFSDMNRLCLVHYKGQYMFSALRTFLMMIDQLFAEVYHASILEESAYRFR